MYVYDLYANHLTSTKDKLIEKKTVQNAFYAYTTNLNNLYLLYAD